MSKGGEWPRHGPLAAAAPAVLRVDEDTAGAAWIGGGGAGGVTEARLEERSIPCPAEPLVAATPEAVEDAAREGDGVRPFGS